MARRFEAQNLEMQARLLLHTGRRADAVAPLRDALAICRDVGMQFTGPRVHGALSRALESNPDRDRLLAAIRALAQVELLNQQIAALRRQVAAIEEALQASEKKDKDAQVRIADLGQRLNVALAQRVQEPATRRFAANRRIELKLTER